MFPEVVVRMIHVLWLCVALHHLYCTNWTDGCAQHAANTPVWVHLEGLVFIHKCVTCVISAGAGTSSTINTDVLIDLSLAIPLEYVLH